MRFCLKGRKPRTQRSRCWPRSKAARHAGSAAELEKGEEPDHHRINCVNVRPATAKLWRWEKRRCCSAIRRESILISRALQAVTAADVQRVMKKYFTDTNRLVLYYLPEASKPAKEGQ